MTNIDKELLFDVKKGRKIRLNQIDNFDMYTHNQIYPINKILLDNLLTDQFSLLSNIACGV